MVTKFAPQVSGGIMSLRLSPAKVALSPAVKQTGQESGVNFVRHFQILIVFAVILCKQCLQTASASGGLRPSDSLLNP